MRGEEEVRKEDRGKRGGRECGGGEGGGVRGQDLYSIKSYAV